MSPFEWILTGVAVFYAFAAVCVYVGSEIHFRRWRKEFRKYER